MNSSARTLVNLAEIISSSFIITQKILFKRITSKTYLLDTKFFQFLAIVMQLGEKILWIKYSINRTETFEKNLSICAAHSTFGHSSFLITYRAAVVNSRPCSEFVH